MIRMRDIKPAVLSAGSFVIMLLVLGAESPLFAYEVISVVHGGQISGTVKVRGAAPAPQMISVSKNREICGQEIQDESIVVNPKNNGLRSVVVFIDSISKGKSHSPANLMINNKQCRFEFHVLSGMVGDGFTIKNSDPLMHNTHLRNQDRSSLVNVAMPPGGRNIQKTAGERELVEVNCDVHKFMHGWMKISDNPYFAITDEEGNFNISDIPPGTYKLKMWHETLAIADKEVVVLPDKTVRLGIEVSPK